MTMQPYAYGTLDDWSEIPCEDFLATEIPIIYMLKHPAVGAFSNSLDAREAIEAGRVRINGEVITDHTHMLSAPDQTEIGFLIQVGKRNRFRIRLAE